MRADWTDVMKARVAFRNFVNASKYETNPVSPSILT